MNTLKRLIPARYHYPLSRLKNIWRGYRQSYYSQFGEDIIIGKLFAGKRSGVYVDVGAHHPRRYSNTYLLYKRGWRGINIDPNPHTKKLFDAARPHDQNVMCGVGRESVQTYYQFSDPALNTFRKEEAERWKHKPWVAFLGEVAVEVRPLASFMQEGVDLLTVDAEGMDLEVLESNDWSRFRPRVVVVEASSEALPAFLESKGYHTVAHMYKTLIFADNSFV